MPTDALDLYPSDELLNDRKKYESMMDKFYGLLAEEEIRLCAVFSSYPFGSTTVYVDRNVDEAIRIANEVPGFMAYRASEHALNID